MVPCKMNFIRVRFLVFTVILQVLFACLGKVRGLSQGTLQLLCLKVRALGHIKTEPCRPKNCCWLSFSPSQVASILKKTWINLAQESHHVSQLASGSACHIWGTEARTGILEAVSHG